MSHLTYSRSLTATTGFLWTRLANENLYLTCFSINSGLTHTNICGCIQLLTNIWYSVLPTTAWFTLIFSWIRWLTSDSAGTYSRVPYYYDSGFFMELHQWRLFSDPQFLLSSYLGTYIVLFARHPTLPVVHPVLDETKTLQQYVLPNIRLADTRDMLTRDGPIMHHK